MYQECPVKCCERSPCDKIESDSGNYSMLNATVTVRVYLKFVSVHATVNFLRFIKRWFVKGGERWPPAPITRRSRSVSLSIH